MAAPPGANPHDALMKASFGQPELAGEELALLLPPDVLAQLDLPTLTPCAGSFVDEELAQSHSDLLFTVRARATGEEVFVFVLLEHQSTEDPLMPFRLLRYIVRIWERWLRENPAATTLPLVIPTVLHHGGAPWKRAPELASMLVGPAELLEAARPLIPHFRFLLDDLAAFTPVALAARPLTAHSRVVQLALWAARSLVRLVEAKPFMRDVVAGLARDRRTRDLLQLVYRYLDLTAPGDVEVETIQAILLEIAGPEGTEDVMNAGEQLIHRGIVKGREEGLLGLRTALTNVLSARSIPLSDATRTRIADCTEVDTFTRWITRAATAATEADVFTDAE